MIGLMNLTYTSGNSITKRRLYGIIVSDGKQNYAIKYCKSMLLKKIIKKTYTSLKLIIYFWQLESSKFFTRN